MTRTVLAGILVAGVVHVSAILTLPAVAPADPVDRVGRIASPGRMTVLPADGTVIGGLDPTFVHAACPFDVSDGLMLVSGQMPAVPWTIAVVVEPAGIAASLERGAVVADALDLVVGRQEDIDVRRVDQAGTDALVTYAATTADRGFVLLRAFAVDRAEAAKVGDTLAAVSCETL